MPTYEYVCEKCDHEFELFQSITANALETCPKDLCPRKRWSKGRVRRSIGTGAGIIFKGSGFYQTDYRSQSYTDAAKADRKAEKDSTSKTDSKSETKSDSSSTSSSSSGSETGSSGSSKTGDS